MPWEIAVPLAIITALGTWITIWFSWHRNRREKEDRAYKNLQDLQGVETEGRALDAQEADLVRRLKGFPGDKSGVRVDADKKAVALQRKADEQRRVLRDGYAARGVPHSSIENDGLNKLQDALREAKLEVDRWRNSETQKLDDEERLVKRGLEEISEKRKALDVRKTHLTGRKP